MQDKIKTGIRRCAQAVIAFVLSDTRPDASAAGQNIPVHRREASKSDSGAPELEYNVHDQRIIRPPRAREAGNGIFV